jgi:hypothetical protein
VYERLSTALEALYASSDRTILSEAAREAQLAQLEAQLLALETEEEQGIRQMEAAGEAAPVRRGDVHFLETILADD